MIEQKKKRPNAQKVVLRSLLKSDWVSISFVLANIFQKIALEKLLAITVI